MSFSTGMKCLPQSKLPDAQGVVLHDWHAEILAIRAFNHFILEECRVIIARGPESSPWLRLRTDADALGGEKTQQPFVWREGISLHMYCSEAPCGDASMELTIAAQVDAAPWDAPLPKHLMERIGHTTPTGGDHHSGSPAARPDLRLLGRACFSHLGVVRRKPARPDAPPTLSKSCSDKLALKQCTSLLNSVASLLLSPRDVYLSSLVLPESQYSEIACERCFSPRGRMAGLGELLRRLGFGYQFRPFEVQTTGIEFSFSRRAVSSEDETRYVASSLATAWNARGLADNIIGGVLQGRKQMDPRGGSAVSRKRLWQLAMEVAELAGTQIDAARYVETYAAMKEDYDVLGSRRQVKDIVRTEALKGWIKNTGDERFGLAA